MVVQYKKINTQPHPASAKIYGGFWYFQKCLFLHGFAISKLRNVLFYQLKAFCDYPWMIYDRLFNSRHINETLPIRDPIFLIGHYRSGTTFLHRILSANQDWNFPNMMDQFFPFMPDSLKNWFRPYLRTIIRILRIPHIMFNKYSLNIDEPVEEEMCLISSIAKGARYWGFVFPSLAPGCLTSENPTHTDAYWYWLKKVSLRKPDKALLLKSPTNTAKINQLLTSFPGARFIFLHRNPYEVFSASENMWNKIEKHFSVQKVSRTKKEKIILKHYVQLTEAYLQQKNLVPHGQLVEVRYEDLIANPKEMIDRITHELGISISGENRRRMDERIKLESAYQPNQYILSAEQKELIHTHWKKYIDHWGYTLS